MSKFKACFNENRYKEQIEADFQAGVDIGVSGTPSVFVNGVQLTPGYVPSFEDAAAAIEAALAGE
jgi:protein-disulfide isomerase